jgi:hypothetical protein
MSVTLSRVSVTTQSFSIVVANISEATRATTSFPLSPPSLVIVADVPMHISLFLPANRSLTRRTSIATSAP